MKKLIAFYPELAIELGDIPSAIYYQQAWYWHDKTSRTDGFFYKSKTEWEEETTLTREQQDRIRTKLVKMGWLEVKKLRANNAPTLHYKPLKELELSIGGKPTYRKAGKTLLEKRETHQSLTESTTEITTKKGDDPRKEARELNYLLQEEFFSNPKAQQHVIGEIVKRKGIPEELVSREIQKFVAYWTEPNKGKTKVRWQGEKYFDLRRRLNTWFANVEKFGPKKSAKIVFVP